MRQLASLAKERIVSITFLKWGSKKTLHFSNSKAALARVDKSLFDVSYKKSTVSHKRNALTYVSILHVCNSCKNIKYLNFQYHLFEQHSISTSTYFICSYKSKTRNWKNELRELHVQDFTWSGWCIQRKYHQNMKEAETCNSPTLYRIQAQWS